MNSASEDLKDILVAGGIGAFGGTSRWAISIQAEADEPNDVVTLYDVSGLSPAQLKNVSLDPVRYPYVQIRVRSVSYTDGVAKMEAIVGILNQKIKFTQGGTYYLGVFLVGEPLGLDPDINRRHLRVASFRIVRRATNT